MVDLGLFLAESFNQNPRLVEDKLAALAPLHITGGLLHGNAQTQVGTLAAPFVYAVDARQLGSSDIDLKEVKFVTYRQPVSDKPAYLSALMAKCADLGATLFVASPFTDGESSNQEIASRGGYKQVNYALAKALLTFLCEEALFYGCRLHIYGVSSNQEIDLLQPFRSKGNVTISIPLYLLADEHDPFGYTYAAKLSPSPIGQAEKLQLLKSIQNGLCDALTTHHHLYAELLELDPLSAEQGAPLDLQLPSLFSQVQTLLGSTLWQNLTETAPRAILSSK